MESDANEDEMEAQKQYCQVPRTTCIYDEAKAICLQ